MTAYNNVFGKVEVKICITSGVASFTDDNDNRTRQCERKTKKKIFAGLDDVWPTNK